MLPSNNFARPYFNPRSPCGERPAPATTLAASSRFQSTLSLRRATHPVQADVMHMPTFQSTLSLRRATPGGSSLVPTAKTFQSTLSLRRATANAVHGAAHTTHFNPRSPCGERRERRTHDTPQKDFNPRSPCGERQRLDEAYRYLQEISIHALLAESDRRWGQKNEHHQNFNPRSPCGERRWFAARSTSLMVFQSTLSLRRATRYTIRHCGLNDNFNPRSPCGERRFSFKWMTPFS